MVAGGMQPYSVRTVVKEAADLWTAYLLRLLPFGALVYALAFGLFIALTAAYESIPFVVRHSAVAPDASVLQGLSGSLLWLIGPLLGVIAGGSLVTLFWASCCRIALDNVTVSAAIASLRHEGRVVKRFVPLLLLTVLVLLAPLAVATLVGGTLGQLIWGAGWLLALGWLGPLWTLLVPLSQRDSGPYLKRFAQLVPPQSRRPLLWTGAVIVAIAALMSIPALLALSLDASPVLVGSVLVPFHAALAPMQAFLQARAYAQLTGVK